jgi:hypothetical protein
MAGDKQTIPSFQEIKQLWDQVDEPLFHVHFGKSQANVPNPETIAFLQEVGFPEVAEPGLDFTDLSDKLFTHSQLYTKDDFPALDEYLVIGSTSEGNPICMDINNGSIVYIDHDNGFEAVFINSSLVQFSHALALYQVTTRDTSALTASGVKSLEERIYSVDGAGLEENSFWRNELVKLERQLTS